uniref:Cytochrome P450 n=1 Tax=Quercus lobata TaxID=97700 RepID=A0A7N2R767_QUELO
MHYNNTTLIQSPYGDHWRNLRRISTLEIFSNNRLNKFLGIRRDEIKHLLRSLSRNSCHGFTKVELQSRLLEMTFNSIMRMVAGKRYYRYAEFVPILRWMDYGGLEKKLKSLSERTDEFLQALIDEQRRKEEEAVEECFTKNDIVLANRPPFLLGKQMHYNNTTLIQSPYGDHWRNLRRISTLEIFSNNRLNKFSGIRRDEIKHLLRSLSRNSCHSFTKVELQSMLLEMTFNSIMRMVAGKRYYRYGENMKDEEEARQFRRIIKESIGFGGASNPAEFVPILRWMDYGGLEKKLKSLSERTDEFLQALIDEQRRKEEEGNTMIDHMLSLQKSQPDYYTDQIIKGLILVLLFAGTGTSTVTLKWTMTNLLNHPNMLKKARDEIDSQIGEDKLIEESDVSKLHYDDAEKSSVSYTTLTCSKQCLHNTKREDLAENTGVVPAKYPPKVKLELLTTLKC